MRIPEIFVTVDAVVFKPAKGILHVLLIKRKNEPFRGQWALPGGFVDTGEDLETAAKRELLEETGISVAAAEQLKAFGKPGRDPRHHTVSVAFMAEVGAETEAKAADDATHTDWFPVNNLPELAFDHAEIINFALTKK